MSVNKSDLFTIDQLIKESRLAEATQALKKVLHHTKIDPEYRLPLARFAKRVGDSDLVIHLLYKSVMITQDASALEKAEYALALSRLGFFNEGHLILKNLEKNDLQLAKLYLGYSATFQWDYKLAHSAISTYLKTQNQKDYEQLVAQVNLAACYVLDKDLWPKAESVCLETLELARATKAHRLEANCYELLAQYYLYVNKDEQSEKTLIQARKLLEETDSFDGLFIKKWRLFIQLKKRPNDMTEVKKLKAFRTEVQKKGLWEMSRDIDFHLGIWNRNRTIIKRLYFGTPHSAYKKRIYQFGFDPCSESNFYDWRLNQPQLPQQVLDLMTGHILNSSTTDSTPNDEVNTPMLVQSNIELLRALASDFYRPVRISQISRAIFPGEHYNPITTPNRVHQAILRLKRQLAKIKISGQAPFSIASEQGYTIVGNLGYFGLRIHLDYPDFYEQLLRKIFSFVGHNSFTTTEISECLNTTKRTMQNYLQELISKKLISKQGIGRSIRYVVTNPQ